MYVRTSDIVLNGVSKAVGNSKTDEVVSSAFSLGAEDTLALNFQVDCSGVSGTGAVVKIQHSLDGTNFVDVDSTNAKVTISGNGRFNKDLNALYSTHAAFMPLRPLIRFVCTTGGSDAVTINKITVSKRG